MLFNSLEFWLFFAVFFAAFSILPHRGRRVLLLIASYVFYGAWDWRFLSLLWFSTGLDFVLGLALGRTRDPGRRRALLAVSLVGNLGVLGFFKYANFFSDSLTALLAGMGARVAPWGLEVILPVGISFYTFQTLSYVIDVYRGQLKPTRNLLDFALFVAFFPQLVAGPIERAAHLLTQFETPRHLTLERIASGAWLIVWGLFKKVVVADNLAALVDAVYATSASPTGPEVVLATYAFAFQIYCDFSGYTDIARGLARTMDVDLMLNFRFPYFATDPSDFWRRWHISLSQWLRDYLYIPLGGNRQGRLRTYRNLMATMVLGGLWHGAAWTFVLWGAYHGALLCVQRVWRERGATFAAAPAAGAGGGRWPALSAFWMFQLVCLGWLFFRAESIAHVGTLLAAVATRPALGLVPVWLIPFAALVLPLLALDVILWRAGRDEAPLAWPLPARVALYAAMICAIVLIGEDGGAPFVYFQF